MEVVDFSDKRELRLRCLTKAPGYLIFYCVIPALWILSDCPLMTFLVLIHNVDRKVSIYRTLACI